MENLGKSEIVRDVANSDVDNSKHNRFASGEYNNDSSSEHNMFGAIHTLSIDLETYSSVDISKSGVYRYAQSDDFEILLMSVCINDEEILTFDGENIPEYIIDAIKDEKVIKWAFNSAFERICLSEWIRKRYCNKVYYLPPTSWRCSMVWSAYMGLPLSLKGVGEVLDLQDKKLDEGKDLIRYFCKPCKPTKTNGMRTRNLPSHNKDKWNKFKAYNVRDVEVEIAIKDRLKRYPVPDFIWDEYHIDQMINDRGILVDMDFVNSAIALDKASKEEITSEIKALTGIDNPNSIQQLKGWLSHQNIKIENLSKKEVSRVLRQSVGTQQSKQSNSTSSSNSDIALTVLKLRSKLAKSSIKKYEAMRNVVCSDNRARGMFQFYGAHTGRYSGRLVQLQNLPKNYIKDLKQARQLALQGDYESFKAVYEDVPDILSQLVRSSFVPSCCKATKGFNRKGFNNTPNGCEVTPNMNGSVSNTSNISMGELSPGSVSKGSGKFIIADFSAIEARVLAWLCNEQWRLDVFEKGRDIYCESASKMFNVQVDKDSPLRQKGKISELALGYGGSIGALKSMGALDMGIEEYELQGLVNSWRRANPNIVSTWWDFDRQIKKAISTHSTTSSHGIKFMWKSGMLFIKLPSNRCLAYVRPRVDTYEDGSSSGYTRENITYEGMENKWKRIEMYGPKFVENVVQAISRDILMNAITNITNEGYHVVAHVHDEIIVETIVDAHDELNVDVDSRVGGLDHILEIMTREVVWAKGLKLSAEGYESDFYRKA